MTTDELTIAKLRYLLYEAIVELQYVQDAEDHLQCASAKAKQIIKHGMECLEVKDLSSEHLNVAKVCTQCGAGFWGFNQELCPPCWEKAIQQVSADQTSQSA